MKAHVRQQIEEEIERLRKRYAPVVRDLPDAQEVVAHWTVSEQWIRWHIELEEVLEPDIDVEIETDCLIVRAQHFGTIFVGVLPIPAGFDVTGPRIRCQDGYLEVYVSRARPLQSVRRRSSP